MVVDSWRDRVIPFRALHDDERFQGMTFRRVPGAANPHPLTEEHWAALISYL
ncbi:hypothetical protein [Microtetraspora niveoalba]|uniref:hypothetical protein n=1 Tax=Microtetraspora niveoalba TaxID=46175 RepID=UPI000B14BD8C|nr:hypothetical protein [Microtetraspora niveoalba]